MCYVFAKQTIWVYCQTQVMAQFTYQTKYFKDNICIYFSYSKVTFCIYHLYY